MIVIALVLGLQSSGLVAHWPFDSVSAGSTPDVAGGNNAALVGPPTAVAGAFGNALAFDGATDYVRANNAAALNFGTSSFSVSLFVRPAATTAGRLVNKWASGTEPGWIFDINESAGGTATPDRLRMRFRDAGGADLDIVVTQALGTGTYRHLVAVVDRTADILRFYLDGAQVVADQSLAALAGSVSNSAQLGMGTIPAATGNFFNGALDEARLYNRVLTVAEIGVLRDGVPGPAGIFATPQADAIELTWAPSAGAIDYTLISNGTPIVTTGATTFTHTGISQADSFTYTVFANTSVGPSRMSPPVTATPLPPPPRVGGDNNEGSIEDNCACGASIAEPGAWLAWAALLLITSAAGRVQTRRWTPSLRR
jgi:hypothetical protein